MDTETIVLGGGCFWCTEAVFKKLKGIISIEPGYAGPPTTSGKAVTYEEVCTGNTPYIEAIQIVYKPEELAFEEILHVFFATHDPTTPNRQGNDIGPQYQSAIFYSTETQKEKSEHYVTVVSKSYSKPIVTQILPFNTFYVAEDYHKNYYERNKSAGYCQIVIEPKVEKVEEKFKHLLK